VLSGKCAFKNPTAKTLRRIKIRLECRETATARRHTAKTTVLRLVSQIPIGSKVSQGQVPFSIRIPEDASASHESPLLKVRYNLSARLDIAWQPDVKASQTITVLP
jgi:hypothetical protein